MFRVESCLANKPLPRATPTLSELKLDWTVGRGRKQHRSQDSHHHSHIFCSFASLRCVQGKFLRMIFLFTNSLFSCIQSVDNSSTEFLIPTVVFFISTSSCWLFLISAFIIIFSFLHFPHLLVLYTAIKYPNR